MPAFNFFAYDNYRVGAQATDGATYDVCATRHAAVDPPGPAHVTECLLAAVAEVEALAAAVVSGRLPQMHPGRLLAPIPRPVNVFGAPVNYLEHRGELGAVRTPQKGTVRDLGLFVKATGSVCGPSDDIELPRLPGREFHYEGEVAVVIGRHADTVPPERALDFVAGFTGALDVTMRLEADHREERSMRKSFKSFTPVGPGLIPLTRPELAEELTLRLSVNGEERQRAQLDQLIMPVAELVALASSVVPLLPGDLILTGTPRGVGPLTVGDLVELEVGGLPPLAMNVTERRLDRSLENLGP